MKTTQTFKIEKDIKEKFKKICDDNFTTPSQELRKFIHLKIKENETKNKS